VDEINLKKYIEDRNVVERTRWFKKNCL